MTKVVTPHGTFEIRRPATVAISVYVMPPGGHPIWTLQKQLNPGDYFHQEHRTLKAAANRGKNTLWLCRRVGTYDLDGHELKFVSDPPASIIDSGVIEKALHDWYAEKGRTFTPKQHRAALFVISALQATDMLQGGTGKTFLFTNLDEFLNHFLTSRTQKGGMIQKGSL